VSTAITIITGRIIIAGGTTTIEHLCLTAGSATLEGMMEEDAEQLGQLRHGRLKNETAARDERRGVTSRSDDSNAAAARAITLFTRPFDRQSHFADTAWRRNERA
jgi:hypothetical protein